MGQGSDNRIAGADFIRALACAIVLFHHLSQRADPASALGSNPLIDTLTATGGFGVAMFFVLSGFLLSRPFWQAMDEGKPLPSLPIFALRRLARIAAAFWLAATVSFVLSFTVFGYTLDGWLTIRYLAGLLFVADWHWTSFFPVEINGPLWSIGFEVSSYLFLPFGVLLVALLLRGRHGFWQSRILWLGVIALAVMLHVAFMTYVPVDKTNLGSEFGRQALARSWMPRFNPFGFFAIFAIGALAGGVQVRLRMLQSVWFDVLTVAGLVVLFIQFRYFGFADRGLAWGWFSVPYDFPLFPTIVGFLLVVAPSSQWVGRALDNGVTRYLARISFGIYVWHVVVLELIRHFWMPGFVNGSSSDATAFLAVATVTVAISVVIADLSYRLLEWPVIQWARRMEPRLERRTRSAVPSAEAISQPG